LWTAPRRALRKTRESSITFEPRGLGGPNQEVIGWR
jgi:hypothetical protein